MNIVAGKGKTQIMMEYIVAPSLQPRRRVRIYPSIKRVVETVVALVLFVLFALLLSILAISVRMGSPGPALFRQTRVGKGGKRFTLYKFRSMYQDIDRNAHQDFGKAFVSGDVAEHNNNGQTVFKPIQANEITKVGRFLRKTSLDELPQLINIIKGDMSFIGPRPNVPAEVEAYKDWHMQRLRTLPGITGLAQVNGRSCIAFDKIAQYDIEYVERESLLLDLKILWKTIPLVLHGHGAE